MEVRRAGERYIAASDEAIFDLSGLVDSNSAAVALLLAWFRCAHSFDRRLEFNHPPEALMNILEVSELAEMLPLVEEV